MTWTLNKNMILVNKRTTRINNLMKRNTLISLRIALLLTEIAHSEPNFRKKSLKEFFFPMEVKSRCHTSNFPFSSNILTRQKKVKQKETILTCS